MNVKGLLFDGSTLNAHVWERFAFEDPVLDFSFFFLFFFLPFILNTFIQQRVQPLIGLALDKLKLPSACLGCTHLHITSFWSQEGFLHGNAGLGPPGHLLRGMRADTGRRYMHSPQYSWD